MNDHARFSINIGTDADPDWQPLPDVTIFEFTTDPDVPDEPAPTMTAGTWEATFTWRPVKRQRWRRWAHRLGILRSPIDTLMGVPFGLRRRW